jgi:DnaJ-class molecular chaperone
MVTCPNCNGRGSIIGPRNVARISQSSKTCPTCGGEGRVENHIGRWSICGKCRGWGELPPMISPSDCDRCNGRGMLPKSRA